MLQASGLETPTQVFSSKFCKTLWKIFFIEHLRWLLLYLWYDAALSIDCRIMSDKCNILSNCVYCCDHNVLKQDFTTSNDSFYCKPLLFVDTSNLTSFERFELVIRMNFMRNFCIKFCAASEAFQLQSNIYDWIFRKYC